MALGVQQMNIVLFRLNGEYSADLAQFEIKPRGNLKVLTKRVVGLTSPIRILSKNLFYKKFLINRSGKGAILLGLPKILLINMSGAKSSLDTSLLKFAMPCPAPKTLNLNINLFSDYYCVSAR